MGTQNAPDEKGKDTATKRKRKARREYNDLAVKTTRIPGCACTHAGTAKHTRMSHLDSPPLPPSCIGTVHIYAGLLQGYPETISERKDRELFLFRAAHGSKHLSV